MCAAIGLDKNWWDPCKSTQVATRKVPSSIESFPINLTCFIWGLGEGGISFVCFAVAIRPIVALVVSPPLLLAFAALQITIWGSFQLPSSYDTILLFSSLFRISCGPSLGLGWSSALAYLLSDLGISLILGLRVQRAYLLFWFKMGIPAWNETKTLGVWNVLKLWGYGWCKYYYKGKPNPWTVFYELDRTFRCWVRQDPVLSLVCLVR